MPVRSGLCVSPEAGDVARLAAAAPSAAPAMRLRRETPNLSLGCVTIHYPLQQDLFAQGGFSMTVKLHVCQIHQYVNECLSEPCLTLALKSKVIAMMSKLSKLIGTQSPAPAESF